MYGELFAFVEENPAGKSHARKIHICIPKFYNVITQMCVLDVGCPTSTFPNTLNYLCDSCTSKNAFCNYCTSIGCTKCLDNYFLDKNKNCVDPTNCGADSFPNTTTGTCMFCFI